MEWWVQEQNQQVLLKSMWNEWKMSITSTKTSFNRREVQKRKKGDA